MGPSFTLAPGEKAVTNARLWVGPKLVSQLAAQDVPGLERAVDYSRFQLFAVLGQGLFWVLAKLTRSEARRVGKECDSPCSSRWAPAHSNKKTEKMKSDCT